MEMLLELFGIGKDLTAVQMSCRGIVIFFITLVLLRISGRRSFGQKTPHDNIIVILLGALLSRAAIVGASPFWPIVCVSLIIVLMHRLFGWITIHSKAFRKLTQGSKIAVYEDGRWKEDNLGKALICEEDVMQGVRKSALTEDLEKIETVYMERNGEISVVKKPAEK